MKALKLVAIQTYVSRATENNIIRHGETINVDPKFRKHLLNLSHVDMTNVERNYFEEVEVDQPTHDFVNKVAEEEVDAERLQRLSAATQAANAEGGDAETDVEQTGLTKAPTAQRLPRTPAAKK